MRKLIVQQFVTVDGIVAESDGGMSFVDAKPFTESKDEMFKAEAMAFLDSIDTMILGGNTYKMFVDYWPEAVQEGIFADKLNQLTKYVASTSFTDAPWGKYSAATVTNDAIKTLNELKQQDGKDIVLWGSITLMRSVLDAGLVDEIQLRICPTTRGEGVRMFTSRLNLELIESKTYERGVVLSKYKLL